MATAAAPSIGRTTSEQLGGTASQAIENHTMAGLAVVRLTAELHRAEAKRATHKLAAILRLCGQDHPATPGKRFSVSQADDFAQVDPEYSRYKQLVSDLSLAKLEAEIQLASARLLAEMAIADFKLQGGLR